MPRRPIGHRHREQEEAYVVVGGSGKVKLDDSLSGPMAPPFVFDAKNIDEFAKVY